MHSWPYDRACPSVPWQEDATHLYVLEGSTWATFEKAPMPAGYGALVQRVHDAAGIGCTIRVYWVTTTYGRGGLYNNGVIVLGKTDVDDIASKVWRANFTPVPAGCEHLYQALGVPTRRYPEIWRATVQYVLAHEYGHAIDAETAGIPVGIPGENAADWHAGRISAALGFDQRLGSMVAHAIGCRDGIACRHGDPATRVAYYQDGIRHARQVAFG